jgi:hypothetical protein
MNQYTSSHLLLNEKTEYAFENSPDKLTTNSREIQGKTSHNMPHNDIIRNKLALDGKSLYPIDSRWIAEQMRRYAELS